MTDGMGIDEVNMEGEDMMPAKEPQALRNGDKCPKCEKGYLALECCGQLDYLEWLQCRGCGKMFSYGRGEDEDCVRRTGEMFFEITEDFFFGDGNKTMRLGADFLKTGQPAVPAAAENNNDDNEEE